MGYFPQSRKSGLMNPSAIRQVGRVGERNLTQKKTGVRQRTLKIFGAKEKAFTFAPKSVFHFLHRRFFNCVTARTMALPENSGTNGALLYNQTMQSKFFSSRIIAIMALVSANLCGAQQLVITPDKSTGVYQVGETVHWRIEWTGSTNAPPARYRLLKGEMTDAGQGSLDFSNQVAWLETKFDAPGTMLVEVRPDGAGGGRNGRGGRVTGGAVAAPGQISLSASRPADFDKFWDAKLKELKKIPINPQLESADIGKTNIAYWKITMDNIRGSHIQGQIARPAAGKKFPALLIVQWAGVYPLQKSWVTDRAAAGWLVLNIEAHDLPIDKPAAFYTEQFAGPLKDYWAIGNDGRDTSYFLRMYLSCYRAVDYLAQRPDWDGKTLVVMGDSQGGQQTLMIAGLHPKKITAALALVPAGADMLGPDAGRKGGWPQWYDFTAGKDPQKVHEASRYYDIANFAPHIKCPVLVGLGLLDETVPAAGVFAAVNQITSPKEVVILPKSGHQNQNGSQRAYEQRRNNGWLPALAQGKPAPVQP
jgi:cephalosporin-C deacetylase